MYQIEEHFYRFADPLCCCCSAARFPFQLRSRGEEIIFSPVYIFFILCRRVKHISSSRLQSLNICVVLSIYFQDKERKRRYISREEHKSYQTLWCFTKSVLAYRVTLSCFMTHRVNRYKSISHYGLLRKTPIVLNYLPRWIFLGFGGLNRAWLHQQSIENRGFNQSQKMCSQKFFEMHPVQFPYFLSVSDRILWHCKYYFFDFAFISKGNMWIVYVDLEDRSGVGDSLN